MALVGLILAGGVYGSEAYTDRGTEVRRLSPTQEGRWGEWAVSQVPRTVEEAALDATPLAETATATASSEPGYGVWVSPTPVPVRARDSGVPVQEGAASEFTRGYGDYGGQEAWLSHFLDAVIPCESTWDAGAVSPGGHLGLVQFAPPSWNAAAAVTGLYDWTNPYHQGAATAVWSNMTVPAEQWSCW